MSFIQWSVHITTIAAPLITLVGLGYAHQQLKNAKQDRAEAQERQHLEEHQKRYNHALSVGIAASWHQSETSSTEQTDLLTSICQVTINNASPYAITNVRLDLERHHSVPVERVFPPVLPGTFSTEYFELTLPLLPFAELTSPSVALHFTDVFGNSWRRTIADLEQSDHPAPTC